MTNLNISSGELLDELLERVKAGEIQVDSIYFYDREKLEISFASSSNGIIFSSDWDAKSIAKCRENYETFCLPLINQQKEKEYKKNLKEFLDK